MMQWMRKLGMDGAIAYTFLARATAIIGSTGTVLLIVHSLSPTEQGYYYTLLSLVSLQLVFELGFSFVIQQLAAHECVHLTLSPRGIVTGDARALARLASTLQLSLRWYTRAAIAMGILLAPLGFLFFRNHDGAGGSVMTGSVAWQLPWLLAVLASMAGLWALPFYSFLEGCGEVRAVAMMRLRQAIAAAAFAWGAMLLHRGLYAPALVIVGQTAMGLLFVASRRQLLLQLLRHRASAAAIDWMSEVWPFQWRIAVSWLCSYFTMQVFIPIMFAMRGAVEAGQLGMSLSISGYMTVLVLSWTSTKATPFGRMIARGEFVALDHLFIRTLQQSLAVFSVIALAGVSGVFALGSLSPHLAHRMVSPGLFALLMVAACGNCIIQSLAIVLRAFKREPFLLQSILVAALTLLLASATARPWGNRGAVMSYLAATACVGLPIAFAIYLRARRRYLISRVAAGAFPVQCNSLPALETRCLNTRQGEAA